MSVVVATSGPAGEYQRRRRPFGLGWPRGLLKQQTGTGRPGGLQLRWSWKQIPGFGGSSGRLWRRTFGWPQGSSGKGKAFNLPLDLSSGNGHELWVVTERMRLQIRKK